MKKQIRTTRTILMIITLVMFAAAAFTQNKKIDTVRIMTSAMCTQCKERIESGLAYEKGVKDVSLDVETKVLTIRYNTKATSPADLRKRVSKLGYDADTIPANQAAYEKLPACCKKDAPKH